MKFGASSVFALCLLAVAQSAIVGPECAAAQTAAQDSLAKSAQKRRPHKSPRGAMLRSLALPGWGQFYNGQWFKGLLVVGAHGALIGYAVHFNDEAGRFEKGSANREFFLDRRNLMFWLLGATKLLSMLDAYIDAHLYDFDTGPDLSLRVGTLAPLPGRRDGPVVGMAIRARF